MRHYKLLLSISCDRGHDADSKNVNNSYVITEHARSSCMQHVESVRHMEHIYRQKAEEPRGIYPCSFAAMRTIVPIQEWCCTKVGWNRELLEPSVAHCRGHVLAAKRVVGHST